VFEFSLSNPSAVDTTIPLHSPMEPLEVLITLPHETVTVPAGATTGTGICTNTDTIAESMRPLLLSGTASATGTINDNDAAQL
jgi:hypothetical protein